MVNYLQLYRCLPTFCSLFSPFLVLRGFLVKGQDFLVSLIKSGFQVQLLCQLQTHNIALFIFKLFEATDALDSLLCFFKYFSSLLFFNLNQLSSYPLHIKNRTKATATSFFSLMFYIIVSSWFLKYFHHFILRFLA